MTVTDVMLMETNSKFKKFKIDPNSAAGARIEKVPIFVVA